jgi:hypothetical protein
VATLQLLAENTAALHTQSTLLRLLAGLGSMNTVLIHVCLFPSTSASPSLLVMLLCRLQD